MSSTWQTINPENITGAPVAGGGNTLPSGLANVTQTPARVAPPPWSPDSGLFWVGLFLAGTVGLYAASVTVKTGPAKASVSI